MLKKILIVLGILVALVILIAGISIYYFMPNEKLVLNFLKENPDKSAIRLVRNDTVIAERNPDKIMPLASTVKIVLAVEYAIQSSKGTINPNEEIPLEALDKFYVKNTDGGAHPRWLKSVEDKVSDQSIAIREIAKGMIRYSSNANTEWLCQKLGLDNINNRVDSLGISDHTDCLLYTSPSPRDS